MVKLTNEKISDIRDVVNKGGNQNIKGHLEVQGLTINSEIVTSDKSRYAYCVCDSAASVEYKDVTVTGFTGRDMDVLFTHGNTYGDSISTYPKLRVTETKTGLLKVYNICDSRGHVAGTGCALEGNVICFRLIEETGQALITNHDVRTQTPNATTHCDGRIISNEEIHTVVRGNEAIPPAGTYKVYQLINSKLDMPLATVTNWFIHASCMLVSSAKTTLMVTQTCYSNNGNYPYNASRTATSTDGGISWNWTAWSGLVYMV